MDPIIKVQCLKHIYPDKTEVNLCGLDFLACQGDKIAVLGPNGAGKTTLLAHILGLLSPVEGTVEVFGLRPDKDFNTIRKSIGVVFQNVDEQIIGPRVYDDIAFTLRNEAMPKEEIDSRVNEIATLLKIDNLLEKIPHYLSGGQKKKVALAGALSVLPKILVLDEPFDGLDPKSKIEMIELLNKLNDEYNITLIVTTHDINIVPQVADIIYVINDGKIVTKGSPCQVFSRVDMLEEANLEPPIITKLFTKLNEKGYTFDIPQDIEEAVEKLDLNMKKRG